jgi:hypothetical protein
MYRVGVYILYIIIIYSPRFSSRIGYLIKCVKPSFGVIFPFNICATPEIIGNLKSNTVALTFVFINCSNAIAV